MGHHTREAWFCQGKAKWKHVVFHHQDGRWTTVPVHKGKDVAKSTFAKILKDIGLTYEEFAKRK